MSVLKKLPIAVARGDGIGPEIMSACLKIFEAAKVPLTYNYVEMGKDVYLKGRSNGMTEQAKETVEGLGILYKGPMETPKGAGVKSINVTARKVWNAFANKRVFTTLPGVDTIFSRAGIPIDLTLVRENIEDTYGGIEHAQTRDVVQCRRLITRPGSLQVHRYAFDAAHRKGARRITCAHKANIMKLTDGLFLETFYEVAKEYPHLKADDVIVDDLAMKLVMKPQSFDIVVLPNLQGDIISDLCAGLVGGLGMAPSANVGEKVSIFEAVHGTAPDITGKGIANPCALLLSGLMMLRHLGIEDRAKHIQTALVAALREGARTADLIDREKEPRLTPLTTDQFADAVIERLPVEAREDPKDNYLFNHTTPVIPAEHLVRYTPKGSAEEKFVGIDVFLDADLPPAQLAALIQPVIAAGNEGLKLTMISNRGTQVWPTGSLLTECVNHYRARLESVNGDGKKVEDLFKVAARLTPVVRVCSLETLMVRDGKKMFTLAQGQ